MRLPSGSFGKKSVETPGKPPDGRDKRAWWGKRFRLPRPLAGDSCLRSERCHDLQNLQGSDEGTEGAPLSQESKVEMSEVRQGEDAKAQDNMNSIPKW